MASSEALPTTSSPINYGRKLSLQALQQLGSCKNQVLATAVVTVGSFGTGTVFGWSAVATDNILSRGDFGSLSKEHEISWVTSLAILGAFVAGPVAGFLMDKLGRKISILLFTFPFILGWAVMCSAYFMKPHGFYLLYVGRLLTGICAGSYLVLIPTYIKEIANDSMRGILGSAMPLTLVSGMLYTFIIGTYYNWATLSCLSGVVLGLLVVGMFMVPETPRFLLVNNRKDEAIAAFQWLNGIELTKDAERKFDSIYSSNSTDTARNQAQNCQKLLTRPVTLPVLIILWVVFFQQFGGVNAVTMYTVEIFRGAGDFIAPHTATIILGVVQVVAVLVSMFIVDIMGRKSLLVICNLIMSMSLAALGYFFYLKEQGDGREESFVWLPIVTVLTYIATYSCGVGSVVWVLASEIYHPDFRAESSTIMTSAYWILGFIVAKTYDNVKMVFAESGSFWFYGTFCFLGAVFALLFVPETKGKSSEEILKHFGRATNLNEDVEGSSRLNEGNDTENNNFNFESTMVNHSTTGSDNRGRS